MRRVGSTTHFGSAIAESSLLELEREESYLTNQLAHFWGLSYRQVQAGLRIRSRAKNLRPFFSETEPFLEHSVPMSQ